MKIKNWIKEKGLVNTGLVLVSLWMIFLLKGGVYDVGGGIVAGWFLCRNWNALTSKEE